MGASHAFQQVGLGPATPAQAQVLLDGGEYQGAKEGGLPGLLAHPALDILHMATSYLNSEGGNGTAG